MYIPTGAKKLSDITTMQQIRLGIQGAPKTGKTWAALTFPNPIVINLDRGLGAHTGKENIIEVPFWDNNFVKTIANDGFIKTAVAKWMNTEARKLSAEQTLILDGSTGLQNAYTAWYSRNPVYTKQGKIDDFSEWRLKIEFFGEIMELTKSLQCNFIYICHETPDRDSQGNLNGKVKPLLTGAFGDQLASHFTDWFRQYTIAKPTTFDNNTVKLDNWGMTMDEFKALCAASSTNTIYAWQTQSDNLANCGSSTLKKAPRYIKADYESLLKWSK